MSEPRADRRMEPLPFSSPTPPLNALVNMHHNTSTKSPPGATIPRQHRRSSNTPPSKSGGGVALPSSAPQSTSAGYVPNCIPNVPSLGGRLAALVEGEMCSHGNRGAGMHFSITQSELLQSGCYGPGHGSGGGGGGGGEGQAMDLSPDSLVHVPTRSSPNRSSSCDPSSHRSKWSRDLDNIRRRANSLAALEHVLDLPSGPYTPTENRQFDLSPTATIKPLVGPFASVCVSERLQESSFRPYEVEEGGGSLHQLRQSLELAKGIIRMASARQGPIMLLSTDSLSSVSVP